jgi:hypothetical protein
VIQFAQDLSLRFEMTDYLACHFERIARNLSSLYGAIHSNCTTTHAFHHLTRLQSTEDAQAMNLSSRGGITKSHMQRTN